MSKKHLVFISVVVLVAILLTGCAGEVGPAGPAGPAGSVGPAGADGADAVAGVFGADYIGADACGECHTEKYDIFMQSGHPYKLNKVENGTAPTYPFTELVDVPEGYTWDDISYVIGGYNWKARFIDLNGYIITGADENATTQYNFYNDVLEMGDNWVGYHAGEVDKVYDCGPCHTTAYNPAGHQDDLPGLIGTWTEGGIMCEECHGPGSLHADNPRGVALEVDRSAAACGDCHVRGGFEAVNASGGFIKHHEQYEELFQSKHLTIDCVDCHDPHTGVIQLRQEGLPTTRISCENCHYKEAQNQAVDMHEGFGVECIDCHMPRISKSALGNIDIFSGDLRTHIMAIDPNQVGQFTEDGSQSLSQISLDFACRHCHVNGTSVEKSDDALVGAASNYHAAP